MPCISDSHSNAVNLFDIDIKIVDETKLYEQIAGFVREGRKHRVMYLNAHCTTISRKDMAYRDILNNAHLVYADGISLIWAARFLGYYLPCRLTAADFMPKFFSRFAQEEIRVFLLGAKPGISEKAACKLVKANPGLKIVGTHHGYFKQSECGEIVNLINKAKPDIVMVGMGVPYQEKWIQAHHEHIDAPVIWGVGALFDFLAGSLPRGPQWLLDSGFEWLCRLVSEPKRLWRRYLIGNLLFIWYLLRWRSTKFDERREV